MKHLEEIRSTPDRPYPRVTEPNQDRVVRPTHTGNSFGSVAQTAGTFHGLHYPRISAKTGLQCLREKLDSATKSLLRTRTG